jgi:hypothetical protein
MLLPFGQKISAKLPVSDDKYYDEYLVNIDYLEKEFKSVGMSLETNDSFSVYFPKYNSEKLSEVEKQFISLYHVYVFYKKPST